MYQLDDQSVRRVQIGSFEAKTRFGAVLDRVERGEEVVITRRGRAVARLVPMDQASGVLERQARALEQLKAIRESNRGKGVTADEIKEWINEGRR